MGARFACLIAALLIASPAHGAWVVDESGRCVERWTPASAAEGPLAVADAPIVPLRYTVGGVQELRQPTDVELDRRERTALQILYVPLAVVASAQEALTQASFGLIDTLTAGYFALAPEDPAPFTLTPQRLGTLSQERSADRQHQLRTDPCGRPLFPLLE